MVVAASIRRQRHHFLIPVDKLSHSSSSVFTRRRGLDGGQGWSKTVIAAMTPHCRSCV
ncbi:hypothetical protein BN2475_90038 [Paraburkholderia ribeironis]|uniref:Uncharacterized protein n=1 Tax=Paraburkholderia ribeironis TaxID=1247936 RepID=A0A1N7RMY2_9BURK|nr:hypothetical protein BN2475_90038 [Paraburkholderia ribeironis]